MQADLVSEVVRVGQLLLRASLSQSEKSWGGTYLPQAHAVQKLPNVSRIRL